ncbi:MAG: chemotaxis protein CheR [Rhodospirillales bacterium RIFCSPLOWO2_12_FULL_58_28]|nr:MAG: chemotaxis protein CheR [Rhodospirillales bacterium RIFCSPLOWO2_02_FULL_58_16]OHC78720.1 MAG: chemotaxis protein CheR [Rhodospirillales bacterium RIFCSPLOWO2_12_FULL_58_28]
MSQENFNFIRELVMARSGLVLKEEKKYLVESRLRPVAGKHGLEDHHALINFVRFNKDEGLINEIIDAMTTNETFFFRDGSPFVIFRDLILPHVMKKNAAARSFRIWCCAASTGQEPYTLAMILRETAPQLAGWTCDIVATDISRESLKRARSGIYTQFEVQRGLPMQMLVKYFRNKTEMWEIDSSLRAMVDFREFNLLDDFTSLGVFDIVFCRNVLIYLEMDAKTDILGRIAERMPKDGFLFLGSSETVLGISDAFRLIPDMPGVYSACPVGGPAQAAR